VRWLHRRLCGSDRWRRLVGERLVPWVLDGVALGSAVLEIGPGPGASTEALLRRVATLTCVESDRRLARELAGQTMGRNVLVLCQDATSMTFARGAFDGAVCLTMLHHVPSPALQDRLFCEVARVLRPGGMFVGADSMPSMPLRLLHLGETFVLVDPATLPDRLIRAGFTDVEIDVKQHAFRFRARRKFPQLGREISQGSSSSVN
jgi:SAM-dependent methyltransferase